VSMLDYKETIEELEAQRGHGKEIKGHDHLPMIGEEGEPPFGRIAPAGPHASEIPGDGALGDLEAELHKFPMDPGCTPICVFPR